MKIFTRIACFDKIFSSGGVGSDQMKKETDARTGCIGRPPDGGLLNSKKNDFPDETPNIWSRTQKGTAIRVILFKDPAVIPEVSSKEET